MNPHDQAYSLAKALKESSEYKAYCQIREKINADEGVRNMFLDLRKKEMELGQKQMMGQEISEREKEQYQKLRELTTIHSVIQEYLEKEERVHVLLMDVQRIISEAIDVGIKEDKEDKGDAK